MFFRFLIIFIIFSPVLYEYIPLLSIIDDIFFIFLLFTAFFYSFFSKFYISELLTFIFVLIYSLFLLSFFDFDETTFLGILYLFKFYLIYFSFQIIVGAKDYDISLIKFSSVVISTSIFLNLLFILIMPLAPELGYNQSYGDIRRNMGFFPNAQRNSFVICFALILAVFFNKRGIKSKYLFLTIANALTFSKKDQIIHIFIGYFKTNKFLLILATIFMGILLSVITIQEYSGITLDSTIRVLLWLVPINNFNEIEWIFGWGPGKWGGHVSSIFYSEYYFLYGLNELWGASPEHSTFLSDGFWPHVLGEIGIFGVMVIVFLLYRVYRNINKVHIRDHRNGLKCIFLLLIVYSFFMSSLEVNIFLIPFSYLAAICNKNKISRSII